MVFPEGPGKKTVETYCGVCHGLDRVANAGYTQAYWHTTIRMMMNFGTPIPPDEVLPLIDYLAKHYPEKPMPLARVIPGPVQINSDGNPVMANSTVNFVGTIEIK